MYIWDKVIQICPTILIVNGNPRPPRLLWCAGCQIWHLVLVKGIQILTNPQRAPLNQSYYIKSIVVHFWHPSHRAATLTSNIKNDFFKRQLNHVVGYFTVNLFANLSSTLISSHIFHVECGLVIISFNYSK